MTPEEIQAARALADFCPPGPWTVDYGAARGGYPQRVTNAGALLIAECFENPDLGSFISEFIAAARTLVPRLLDALDEARAELAATTRFMDEAHWQLAGLTKQRDALYSECACLPDVACGGTGDVDPGEAGYCAHCMARDVYDECPRERAEAAVVEARKAALLEAADEVWRIRNGESNEPGPYAGYIEAWLRARADAQPADDTGPTTPPDAVPHCGHYDRDADDDLCCRCGVVTTFLFLGDFTGCPGAGSPGHAALDGAS